MKVKGIEIVLYAGDVRELPGKADTFLIILALTPSIPPTPCLYFQSFEIFDSELSQPPNTEEIELVFNLSEEINRSIKGTFDYTSDIIIYVNNGRIYDQLTTFMPKVEQELDWIYGNLKRDSYYDVKKISQNKYEISLKS